VNDRERFLAVAGFQEPDYVPIFGFPGAPGMAGGCMAKTHDRLVATGMPGYVGGRYAIGGPRDVEGWYRYGGTTGPIEPDFSLAKDREGFKTARRVEGEYEIIESESGAVTRQVIDNDITYSMPQFIRYPVRDRESWELWKRRMTPRGRMGADEMEQRCRALDERDRPLCVRASGSYGMRRGLMGPEGLSLAFYDDPQLVHDMVRWEMEQSREYEFPLVERLRPEIVGMGADICYNHGMLLSPAYFHEFCGPQYRAVCDCARAHDVPVVSVDTDGNAMEFTAVAACYGVNAIYPYEVKAGNDLFLLRERHPRFLLFGWLEKETTNEGNERLIEPEIMGKVPQLLAERGYFPNGDHGIQPLALFPNLCRFMTILHEACGNPEGEFPRA
jgi:uroporphyrinogen decarboxylase